MIHFNFFIFSFFHFFHSQTASPPICRRDLSYILYNGSRTNELISPQAAQMGRIHLDPQSKPDMVQLDQQFVFTE